MSPIATASSTLEMVNVKATCQSLLEAIAGRAGLQRVTVDIALAPEPAWVVAIPSLLRGALHRLMLRALRSMPHGGTLSVLVQRRGGDVAIEVADTGFDASSHLRAVRVGLRAFGGSIRRELDDDRGTRFVVEVPAAAEQPGVTAPCKARRVTPVDTRAGDVPITAAAM